MSLYDDRAKLVADMRAILDRADKEERDLSVEDTAEYERMEGDLEKLDEKIADLEKAQSRRDKLAEREAQLKHQPPSRPQLAKKDDDTVDLERQLQKAYYEGATYREAIRSVAKQIGDSDLGRLQRGAIRQYFTTGVVDPGLRERAALQMDSDTAGGAITMPEELLMRLIDGLDQDVFLRRLGTVLPMTQADSISAPSLANDPADSDWTGEILTGSADSTMDFGKRMLHPHPLAKSIRVSKTLIRRSIIPVEELVMNRLRFKFAVTEEKGFLTGHGSNQPLGLFTASDDGISTGQDVSTDNTTTALTADGLIEAKYGLAAQYHTAANLRWIFHRDAVKQIRKLKDGNGDYLFQPGLSSDRPNTILDVPYEVSEYAPNTFTTGLYVGIIGDMTWYWIAESLNFTVQVARELYAATNQDGFFARAEVDGMPVLEEAFIRVTLA